MPTGSEKESQRPDTLYPQGSSASQHHDEYDRPFRVRVGTIIESCPHARAYLVQLPDRGPEWAIPADNGSGATNELGVTSFHTYAPGSVVICVTTLDKTIVLAGIPLAPESGNETAPLWLFGGSGVGICDGSYTPSLVGEGNTIENSAVGTPADTLVGDWGVSSPFGPIIIVSEFHAALGVSAACGVEAHVIDELLRLSGYNLDMDTSATGLEIRHNQAENRVLFGVVKFPQERLGVVEADGEPFKKGGAPWEPGSHKIEAKYEPTEPDQVPFFRWQEHSGFLGDLKRNFVAIPCKDVALAKYSDDARYIGVLEEHYGADGGYHLRSARGIVLAKTIPFPVPEATQPIESPEADEEVEHEDQEDWDWESFEPEDRAGALVDYLAYRFNWFTRANYPAHEEDWRLREEADVANELGMETAHATEEALDKLRTAYRADPPKFTKLKVDSRTGELRYGQTSSYVELGDDGSIALGDTHGSQIIMANGHITITCPGDINLRPGRSSVTWAPKDIIQRAGSNVDISATDEDVRIKAEKDVAILAGNNEEKGGILLESRAPDTRFETDEAGTGTSGSGVTVKCLKSSFSVWSDQTHIETDSKPLSLNAAHGLQPVTIQASSVLETVDQTHTLLFRGPEDDSVRTVHIMSEGLVTFAEAMIHTENAVVTFGPGIYTTGNVACAGEVTSGSGVMGQLDGEEFEEQLEESRGGITAAKNGYMTADEQAREAIESNPSHPANEEPKKKFGFSMRTDEQYGIGDDFTIVCSQWQRHVSGGEWEEKMVRSPVDDTETYPHPGSVWEEEDVFRKPEFDEDQAQLDENGIPTKRDKGKEPGEVEMKEMKPSEGYVTLRKPQT